MGTLGKSKVNGGRDETRKQRGNELERRRKKGAKGAKDSSLMHVMLSIVRSWNITATAGRKPLRAYSYFRNVRKELESGTLILVT